MSKPFTFRQKKINVVHILSHNLTPQYLSQTKSYLHETFSIFQDWSPEINNNVGGHVHGCMHAQPMEMCMQLEQCDTPQFLSQMNADFHQTWYKHEVDIKDVPKKLEGICTCM